MARNEADQKERSRKKSWIGLTGGVSTDGYAETVPILDGQNVEMLPDGSAMMGRRGSYVLGSYSPQIPTNADSDDPNRIALTIDSDAPKVPSNMWLLVGCDKSNQNAVKVLAPFASSDLLEGESLASEVYFASRAFMCVWGSYGGNPDAKIAVRRRGAIDRSCSVNYTTAEVDGGTTHVHASGTITFSEGEAEKVISVQLEGSGYQTTSVYFTVMLSSPTNNATIHGTNPVNVYLGLPNYHLASKLDAGGTIKIWAMVRSLGFGEQGRVVNLAYSPPAGHTVGPWRLRRVSHNVIACVSAWQNVTTPSSATMKITCWDFDAVNPDIADGDTIAPTFDQSFVLPSSHFALDPAHFGSAPDSLDLLPYDATRFLILTKVAAITVNLRGFAIRYMALTKKSNTPVEWGYKGTTSAPFYDAIIDPEGYIVAHRWVLDSVGGNRAFYLRINPITGALVSYSRDPFTSTTTAVPTPLAPWKNDAGAKRTIAYHGGHLWAFDVTLSSKTDLGAISGPLVAKAPFAPFTTGTNDEYGTMLLTITAAGKPAWFNTTTTAASLAHEGNGTAYTDGRAVLFYDRAVGAVYAITKSGSDSYSYAYDLAIDPYESLTTNEDVTANSVDARLYQLITQQGVLV